MGAVCTEETSMEQTKLLSFLVKQPHTGGKPRLYSRVLFAVD